MCRYINICIDIYIDVYMHMDVCVKLPVTGCWLRVAEDFMALWQNF